MMKIVLRGILITSPILAKISQMEMMFSELKNKTLAGYRGIVGDSVTTLEPIWNYGCWCYFEENHGEGSGEPQNAVDQLCQTLHHGYTCVMMDAESENSNCTG